MAVDISGIGYFMPIWSFLLVAVVSFAVLKKTEIVQHTGFQIFISLLLAIIFSTAASAREYVERVTPWAVILIFSLFFVLMLVGFVGNKLDVSRGVGMVFLVLIFIIFIVAAVFVFSSSIGKYIPGASGYGTGNPDVGRFTDWIFSGRVLGAIVFIIVAAGLSWALAKIK